jgi:hypothetical protein
MRERITMTEKKMKGLFGGGEAPGSETAAPQSRSERRRGGGGRRRRRDAEETARAQDFINRYRTGHPSEGFSSDEAVGYLRELRREVPPEVMQRAAVETVRNLPEDQRKAFAEMLQRRQAGTGMVTIERTGESHATQGRGAPPAGGMDMDDMLGGLFGGMLGTPGQPMPQPQPRTVPGGTTGMDDMLGGLLGGLLGGSMAQPQPRGQTAPAADQGGNPFDDLFGGLFGGRDEQPETPQAQQTEPQQQQQRGGVDEILKSPLGKAVLGGIAAFALKEMMDKDGRL